MPVSSMCRRGAHVSCKNALARCDCDHPDCEHEPGQMPPAPGGSVPKSQRKDRSHVDKYADLAPPPVPPKKEAPVARAPEPPAQPQPGKRVAPTVELVECEPPVTRTNVVLVIEQLGPLLDEMKPNVWYRAVTFGSKTAAATAKKAVATEWPHLELKTGLLDEGGSGLWAMVPDGTVVEP